MKRIILCVLLCALACGEDEESGVELVVRDGIADTEGACLKVVGDREVCRNCGSVSICAVTAVCEACTNRQGDLCLDTGLAFVCRTECPRQSQPPTCP